MVGQSKPDIRYPRRLLRIRRGILHPARHRRHLVSPPDQTLADHREIPVVEVDDAAGPVHEAMDCGNFQFEIGNGTERAKEL